MLLLNIIFWIFVAIDAGLLGVFFLLSLAAAGASHPNPLSIFDFLTVAAFVLLPALVLAACVAVFLKADATGWRVAVTILAASPLLVAVGGQGWAEWTVRAYQNSDGSWNSFKPGPLRDLEAAITQNDLVSIATLARKVKLNDAGLAGVTPLLVAIRQLEKTPTELDALRILLEAGADVNGTNGDVLPLVAAIRVSRQAGPEPMRMLLKAGAKPNQRDEWGTPAFLDACGTTDSEVLKVLLDSGADLKLTDRSGNGALMGAIIGRNWKSVLLLLERGADWRSFKTRQGQGLLDRLESEAHQSGDGEGLADVIRFVKAAAGQQ